MENAALKGSNCRTCVDLLIKTASKKSLMFRGIHSIFVLVTRLLLLIYGIKQDSLFYKTDTCKGCLRPAKNALKARSALFRKMNTLIDPYFDAYLERLTAQESEIAEQIAANPANGGQK